MNLSKKDKTKIKIVLISILVVSICAFVSLKLANYLLIPQDKITNDTKEYYILSSSEYFKDKTLAYISIENLIKSGYAEEKRDIINNQCDVKNSFISKQNDTYYLTINCDNFISDLKIKGNL